ncbi:MAG TPA: response regulator transcription factor [Nitrospiraceae bacterium]|nr:response regulator transcription factor [Nitrospiraceae bacterium]
MHQPRIFIADDHPLVLEGFRQLLAADAVIVGTAHSGAELLEKAQWAAPDIVLLDVSMPDTNGFELIPSLKEKVPRVKIILVTMLSEPFYVSEGFRKGAHGYVLKQSASAELMTAIRTVMSDRRYVSPDVAEDVRESIQHPWIRPKGYNVQLTPRQQEVLRMLANGFPVKTIATTMGISVKTVEFHKAGIVKKLGVKTASDLTRFALAQGLTEL